jgi:predicted enzyme related to lactoylglutathione lyase
MTTPRSNSYIGITTEHFKEAAEFYLKHFDFTINAESDRFMIVQAPNGKRILGFSFPSPEKGLPEVFGGAGIHLTFLVEDADDALKTFKDAGVSITRGIRIEDWGEKHFVITDPSGIELYISEAQNKNG